MEKLEKYVAYYRISKESNSNKGKKEIELGLTDLPKGTWVGSFYFDQSAEEVYQEFVKTGIVKGFSIEGLFALTPTLLSIEDDYTDLFNQIELLLK